MGLHPLIYREQHVWIWSVLGTQFLGKEWCVALQVSNSMDRTA